MGDFVPKYFSCIETGLSVCEIRQNLLVRVDGMVKNINKNRSWRSRGWFEGSIRKADDYRVISDPTTRKQESVHRLVAEAFVLGDCSLFIDHIDGNKANNKMQNLRRTTIRGNGQNRKEHRLGHLVGTTFRPKENKWNAQIMYNNSKIHLGRFDTEIDAHKAYMSALDSIEKVYQDKLSRVEQKKQCKTSRFKGVSFNRSNKKWIAQIQRGYKKIMLGAFDTEEEAHECYLRSVISYDFL